jgi:D-arabinose 1-dehydrogenase-like Zn-dependent alcohol dehydrogenase
MTTMKRIQYHQYGGPGVMRFEDFEPTRPGPGEVLVRVKAAAANPMDWKIRNGEMKIMTGRKFPRGLGHDFAGVVAAVGAHVTRLGVGDEVLGGASLKAAGAFAEMVVAEEKAVVTKPANLSWEEAAAIPIVGLTAFQAMVNTSKLHAGHAVFIHGCLGGVGRSAAQIAVAHGATVGGSCRGTAAHEAHDLGIAPIVEFDFDAMKLAGRFDVVFRHCWHAADQSGTGVAQAWWPHHRHQPHAGEVRAKRPAGTVSGADRESCRGGPRRGRTGCREVDTAAAGCPHCAAGQGDCGAHGARTRPHTQGWQARHHNRVTIASFESR